MGVRRVGSGKIGAWRGCIVDDMMTEMGTNVGAGRTQVFIGGRQSLPEDKRHNKFIECGPANRQHILFVLESIQNPGEALFWWP